MTMNNKNMMFFRFFFLEIYAFPCVKVVLLEIYFCYGDMNVTGCITGVWLITWIVNGISRRL